MKTKTKKTNRRKMTAAKVEKLQKLMAELPLHEIPLEQKPVEDQDGNLRTPVAPWDDISVNPSHPDWNKVTNFKMGLQRTIEEINQKIDVGLAPDPSMLMLKSLSEQGLRVTIDDLKFFHDYYYNDQPHTSAERKRFERLTLPVSWFWFWYGYHVDSLAKKEAQKRQIIWDAERQNRHD